MLHIGVTGLMGSGKSTVARRFGEHGAHLVDADAIGWEVLQMAEIQESLVERFGPVVLGPDGRVNRRVLGPMVFRDATAMARLNSVVQPLLSRRVHHALFTIRGDGVAVLDAALLSVWRLEPELDGVVETVAPAEIRTRRLRTSKGYSESEARERVLGQTLPPVGGATRYWQIDNAGTKAELLSRADQVWREIEGLCAERRTK